MKRAFEKIPATVAPALRLAALDVAGHGGCGQSARQSRGGEQSGERAAPSDATGLASAERGVCGAVFAGRYSAYRVRHWAVTAGGAIVASRFGSRWLHKLRFAIPASPHPFHGVTPLSKVRVFPLKK